MEFLTIKGIPTHLKASSELLKNLSGFSKKAFKGGAFSEASIASDRAKNAHEMRFL